MAADLGKWVLGIDGTNLREGGGLIHLIALLAVADPADYGFGRVIVWGNASLLDQIAERSWLLKSPQAALERNLPWRALWQTMVLPRLASRAGCDLLFVPGGSYFGNFRPVVAMSQNMLPFDWTEMRRYGLSVKALRLLALRIAQGHTFRNVSGVIFLMDPVKERIEQLVGPLRAQLRIVPHGINTAFYAEPKAQQPIDQYSWEHPFRALYVSTVDMYKHQWHVAEAIMQLRKKGLPLVLDLVGPAYGPALSRLERVRARIDSNGEFVRYHGSQSHSDLPKYYHEADLVVFASSCENMPIILLEAMASGLPIVCSSRTPMPEVLQDGGLYCDPEKPDDIARAIRRLVNSPRLRAAKAELAVGYAQKYSWQRSADATFAFFGEVVRGIHKE